MGGPIGFSPKFDLEEEFLEVDGSSVQGKAWKGVRPLPLGGGFGGTPKVHFGGS